MKLVSAKMKTLLLLILTLFSSFMAYLWIKALLFNNGRFNADVNSLYEGWIEVIIILIIFILSAMNSIKSK